MVDGVGSKKINPTKIGHAIEKQAEAPVEKPVERELPTSAVAVEVDERQLKMLSVAIDKQPKGDLGGTKAMDIRMKVDGDKVVVGADGKDVASVRLPNATSADVQRLADTFAHLPDAELVKFGASLSRDLGEAVKTINDAGKASDKVIDAKNKLLGVAMGVGNTAGTVAFLAAAAAYYAAAAAVVGTVAGGIVLGTVFWPASVPALVVAMLIGMGAKAGVETVTMAAGSPTLTEPLQQEKAANEVKDGAIAQLGRTLKSIGIDIKNAFTGGGAQ